MESSSRSPRLPDPSPADLALSFVEHPGSDASIHVALADGTASLMLRVEPDGRGSEAMLMVCEGPAREGETQKTSVVTLPWAVLRGLVERVAARRVPAASDDAAEVEYGRS